jgi:hypothetical protein
MIDYATPYKLASWKDYPCQQWQFAISKFPAPSNRPPAGFWQQQRSNAIAFLTKYGIEVTEKQGRVYIGNTQVDSSYIA